MGLGVRESVVDFARVLSQYVDVLAARTFSHATVEELARSATIPVINALSDASHPCQAMADFMTIEELRGPSFGKKLVFVGDGNNVARSLAAASALLGVKFVLAAPPGYEFPPDFQARFAARFPGVSLVVERDPQKAVDGADVVYTDVWASMGQEHEAEARRGVFAPYQVNQDLLAQAKTRCDLPPLPSRPSRRRGDLGCARRPAQPGHSPGGEPASFSDGAPGLAAR